MSQNIKITTDAFQLTPSQVARFDRWYEPNKDKKLKGASERIVSKALGQYYFFLNRRNFRQPCKRPNLHRKDSSIICPISLHVAKKLEGMLHSDSLVNVGARWSRQQVRLTRYFNPFRVYPQGVTDRIAAKHAAKQQPAVVEQVENLPVERSQSCIVEVLPQIDVSFLDDDGSLADYFDDDVSPSDYDIIGETPILTKQFRDHLTVVIFYGGLGGQNRSREVLQVTPPSSDVLQIRVLKASAGNRWSVEKLKSNGWKPGFLKEHEDLLNFLFDLV